MPAQVDVVHGLSKINKAPAVEANILGRLELVVELEKSGELMVVRRALPHIMRKLELQQQFLDLMYLLLAVVKLLVLLFKSLVNVLATILLLLF